VGDDVFLVLGCIVGVSVGRLVWYFVELLEDPIDGSKVGAPESSFDGYEVDDEIGDEVDDEIGDEVGDEEGDEEGDEDGDEEKIFDGWSEGLEVGFELTCNWQRSQLFGHASRTNLPLFRVSHHHAGLLRTLVPNHSQEWNAELPMNANVCIR